jgi:hypothetical protein
VRGAALGFAALLALGLGACTPVPSTFAAGYYGIDESVVIRNLTIDEGSYAVGYSVDLRLVSPVPGAAMACQLDEVSGRLATFQDEPVIVRADDAWTTLTYSESFDVPNITVSLRCRPLVAGQYAITARNVALTATPT